MMHQFITLIVTCTLPWFCHAFWRLHFAMPYEYVNVSANRSNICTSSEWIDSLHATSSTVNSM